VAKAILIADDEIDDLIATSSALKRAGIKSSLMTVDDGTEVIAYIKGEREYADRRKFPLPRVLLLDLKMRRIGGFEVMQWLRDRRQVREILVVVLTGHGDLENVLRAYQSGARSFLRKPCAVKDVKNLMRAYSTYWETDGAQKQAGMK